MNILSLAGRLMPPLLEKIHLTLKTSTVLTFLALSAGGPLFAFSSSFLPLAAGACLIGLGTGFATTLYPLLLSEYCGET